MATSLGPIPLFGLGNVGKSVNVDAQKRVNLYAELEADQEKSSISLFPTPGLLSFVNFGAYPCRGLYQKGDFLYVVNRFTLWRVANDGSMTNMGTLLTSAGRVDMTDNGTQIIIVDGVNGYILNTNTSVFSQITSPNWPGADTVTFLNGYFVVTKPNTGQFYCSAIYDGLTWAALDFATAESNPDNLIRVIADNGQLCLFGPVTTEFWGDSGALDFPFSRIGASAIEWGLAARWSLAKFMDSLIFLRRNRLGSVQVCTLSGYNATPVSNPEMDYVFSRYAAVDDATGFSYMVSGHPFYQINFPTPGESWLYDGLTKAWSKVESSGGRHRGEIQQNFLSRNYVSDYSNGLIYLFQDGLYTDNGAQIARELTTRHQSVGEWTSFDEVWIEFEAGTGTLTGQGANPMAMLQVSKDGGHTWGNEYWVQIGKQGEYRRRAVWRRLGRARDWLFKIRITDPVKVVFVAGWGRVGK